MPQLLSLVAVTALSLVSRAWPQDATDVPPKGTPYQHPGITNLLPAFRDQAAARLTFPYSWRQWRKRNGDDFEAWRGEARQRVLRRFLAAPPAVPFDARVIDSRKRNGYTAHKIVFNLTGDSRVLAYLLVPDGDGPHPAVLLLHDHGAEFRIGKEKMVEPWDVPEAKATLACKWVDEVYGGRFLGDELAARGYVCLAYDALNWSDRGGAGFDGQQALAANLLHLGMSYAGVIAHEDLRGAELLASRPEVDKRRIGAMGHSMGSFRTWQVAAMSDHISAGVCSCWMATVKGLMVPGNNQTKGQSAFTMTHPGLSGELDYPDVASLACPKPMLFFAGEQDGLFPVASVKDAYAKMHDVWKSRDAGGNLMTKVVPVPHLFNAEMQEEGFAWLDRHLKSTDQDSRPRTEAQESSGSDNVRTIETTLVDSDADFYGTFQSHNQTVVSAADGIFMTYSKQLASEEPGENERCLWRLVRSVDGGKSFRVAYESTGGTRAPALEVDKEGTLYMAHPDWTDPRRPFYFYRFKRGGDYGKPAVTTFEDVSCAAKYAMVYDPLHNVFYIAAQYGQLLTVDPEGKLLNRGRGFRQTGPHASTQYPHVAVSPDGVLHLAMTTVGPNKEGKPVYWDIHYMNSPDGGRSWRKLDGSAVPKAPVPDDTGPTDRISLDDEFEVNSWLANMLVKEGKVHFIYHGRTMHYLRYDLATGKKDVSFDGKEFAGKDLALCNVSGLLATRVDQAGSPLYCVARDPARRTLACLVSHDNGAHWSDYAVANRTFDRNYATGGTHAITETGHIIGSFTDSANQSVWFYRIKAE